jgi:hypothetical protein
MQTQRIEAFQTIAIPSRKSGWLLVWVIVLAIGVVALFMYPVMRLGYIYQINYSEGWNTYHQCEVIEGQPLYTDVLGDPFTPVNSSPLSFYLVGFLGNILGSYLMAGRITSLLSLIGIAILCPLVLHSRGVRWKAGIFASLVCLAVFTGYAPEYIAMNDQHILALFLSFTGLLVYVYRRETFIGLVFSTILLSSGIITSQNVFPALLAVGLDTFIQNRKHGMLWLGLTVIFFFLLDAVTASHFSRLFLSQFKLIPNFSLDVFLNQITRLDLPFLFFVMVSGWAALFAYFQPIWRLFAFYLAASFLTAVIFSGGSSSGTSQLFDLFLAMGLMLGLSVNKVPAAFKQIPGLYNSTVWLLPPLITLALLFHIPDRIPRENTWNLLASVQNGFQQDAAYLKSQPGRVFCENLLLCFMAEKPLEMDAMNSSELAIQGETNENLALLVFESRQFDIIQINRPLPDNLSTAAYTPGIQRMGSMTQNMRIAIAHNYIIDHKSTTGVFYVPGN